MCESLTVPYPVLNKNKEKHVDTLVCIFFFCKSCTMCRGFIQGLAHIALYLLGFCSDVQQIPLQT